MTPARVLIVTPSVLCLFCSRAHSPALGAHSFSGVQRFNFSSHSQSPRRHSVSQSPNSNSNSSYLTPETEPIVPELCIDHLWTEAITSMRFGIDVFILKKNVAKSLRKCLGFCLSFLLAYSVINTDKPTEMCIKATCVSLEDVTD